MDMFNLSFDTENVQKSFEKYFWPMYFTAYKQNFEISFN